MAQEEVSLWTEIKKHEDTLAKDPLSCSFATLAELYRKVGLLDEAIDVASKGCGNHPEYVGGFMALGRAYFEKGMKNESREALEKVIAVTSDNNLALKLLSQLYLDCGEYQRAEKVLHTVLAMNPDDVESNLLLRSMGRKEDYPADPAENKPIPSVAEKILSAEMAPSTNDMIDPEEIDVVEELTEELLDDEDYFAAELFEETPPLEVAEPTQKDPLTTVTLAELYVSQGFIPSALKIYRELLSTDPDNQGYLSRCDELQTLQKEEMPPLGTETVEGIAADDPINVTGAVSEIPVKQLSQETDENSMIEELEALLDNIRRMRNVI